MRIEQSLTYFPRLFTDKEAGYYMTYVEGIVTNPHNKKKTLTVHKFIVDTGAAISILNRRFKSLFDKSTLPITHVNIHYGGGITREPLPVYKVIIKIKGVEFELLAAFDKNMTLTSLLGHHGFLNELEHLGISKKNRKLTLIK